MLFDIAATGSTMDFGEETNLLPNSSLSLGNTSTLFNGTHLEDQTMQTPFNHSSSGIIDVPNTVLVTIFFLRALWSLLSFFGNILTCLAVYRYENLQTTTNYLICNLAISDLLAALLTPLTYLLQIYKTRGFYGNICIIEKTLNLICTGGNYWGILWLAVDRYLYIAHPLKYPYYVTRNRTFSLIGLSWANIIVQSCLVFGLGNQMADHYVPCKFIFILKPNVYKLCLLPQFITLLPLTIGFHIAIARIAHRQSRAIAAMNYPYDTLEASSNRSQRKIAKMMSTVLGAYLLTTLPEFVASLVMRMTPSVTTLTVEMITSLIYWMNSWLNPIIYAWKSDTFRTAFRKILCQYCKCNNQVSPIQNSGIQVIESSHP